MLIVRDLLYLQHVTILHVKMVVHVEMLVLDMFALVGLDLPEMTVK